MASVDIVLNNVFYMIEYSLVTGEIKDFIKINILNRERVKVTNEKEKMLVIYEIIKAQSQDKFIPGYSYFIYKLAKEGKVKLPKGRKR